MERIKGAYHVYRFGDAEPTGIATELPFAKRMLTDDGVEGDVRDYDGKVLWTYAPKKPLRERLDAARAKLGKARVALTSSECDVREAEYVVRVLERVEASETAKSAHDAQQPPSLAK